ncbi:MAG TPA: replicative DNA helicase [Catalimonadaceae bacterium]|nr:replicative DNA helicase [Catalimonadaceae bacterium]
METTTEVSLFQKNLRKSSQSQKQLAEEIVKLGGKVVPQVPEVEEAVLGALLLDKDALITVSEILRPDCFYSPENQKLFSAILDLFAEGKPVDVLTVAARLKETNDYQWIGGAKFLARLASKISSAAHVEIHSRIVLEHFIKRELISASTVALRDSYEDATDVFELLDRTETAIFQIAEKNIGRNVQDMKSLIRISIENILAKKDMADGITGVPSGLIDLDRFTGGWQNSDLVILAARPGMGKTAFVLTAARNAAVQFKKGVVVFSLEMPAEQLVNRMISAETGLPGEKLRKGRLEDYEWQQLHNRVTELSNAPILIDDTPAISPVQLRAKCRRLKAQHDISLIIIDYLQLMSVEGMKSGNRVEEVSLISRSLKALAKELNVPVIALSQLSRNVETRGGIKRPMLSDLRESGAIEQDADIVSFLYRPEYYGLTEDEDGNPCQGMVEFIMAKHRNGQTGTIKLRFLDQNTKFVDYDQTFVSTSSGYVDASLPDQIGSDRIKLGSKLNSTLPGDGFMDIPPPLLPEGDVPF